MYVQSYVDFTCTADGGRIYISWKLVLRSTTAHKRMASADIKDFYETSFSSLLRYTLELSVQSHSVSDGPVSN